MNTLIFIHFIHLSFCTGKPFFENDTYHILMMLKSESTRNVENTWSGPAFNDYQSENYHLSNITEAIKHGEFRTNVVPSSNSEYDVIGLALFNEIGENLWWIAFNGTDATYWMHSWLTAHRVVDASFDPESNGIYINGSAHPYQMYIGPIRADPMAWFAVYDGLSTKPMFFFSPVHQSLSSNTGTGSDLLGCWKHDGFDSLEYKFEKSDIKVQDCIDRCSADQYNYALMEMRYKCSCATALTSLATQLSSEPVNCQAYCNADPTKICGKNSNWFATYSSGTSTSIPPTIPTGTLPTVTHQITAAPVDNVILSGELNFSGFTGYITTISLVPALITTTFHLYYHPVDCTYPERKPYTDLQGGLSTIKSFKSGIVHELTLTPTRCLWIEIQEQTPITSEVSYSFRYPTGDTFYTADYLAIVGISLNSAQSLTIPSGLTTSVLPELTSSTVDKTTRESSVNYDDYTTSSVTETLYTTETSNVTTRATEQVTNSGRTTDAYLTTVDISSSHEVGSTQAGQLTTLKVNYGTSTSSSVSTSQNNCTSSCACVSPWTSNITQEELARRIEELRKSLRLNKRNLSSSIRKTISAPDHSTVSRGIGGVGIAVLVVVLLSIVAMDIDFFFKFA